MEPQQFILSNYINDSTNESLLEKLRENGINTKDYPEQNLTVLYNKYESRNKSPLQMECRSIIIERDSRKIICYSCPTPLYNIDAVNYMWRNSKENKDTYICYEGSLMSIFNNNTQEQINEISFRRLILIKSLFVFNGMFRLCNYNIDQTHHFESAFVTLLSYYITIGLSYDE